MVRNYITAKEFSDFSKNQRELINILNHSMTKIMVDVSWLKKLGIAILVVIIGAAIMGGV